MTTTQATADARPPHARPGPAGVVPGCRCLVVPLEGLRSRRDERAVARVVAEMGPGCEGEASYVSGRVRLVLPGEPCPVGEVAARLARLGYRLRLDLAERCKPAHADGGAAGGVSDRPITAPADAASPAAERPRWLTGDVVMVLLSGAALLAAFSLEHLGVFAGQGWWAWARAATLVLSGVLASTRTFPEALHSLRQMRLDVDVLMFVAAGGAAALGELTEGAFLLFLFGAGAAGESLALARARHAISSLSAVAPEWARRVETDGSERMVPASSVQPGDVLRVLAYERLPADGVVVEGASSVNQAAITGESEPVEKRAGDAVFAGTINGASRLVVRSTRTADDTTLARVVRLVEEARTEKSPTQVLTDKVERVYVPVVFALTVVCVVAPPLLGWGTWATWFYRAMAFLTAASPCALAIGTPAAVLCGVARAARMGVVVKGGGPLEALGRMTTLCLDKTGTLTLGRPVVSGVAAGEGFDEAGVLSLAAAVEAHSNHPLAGAIVLAAAGRGEGAGAATGVRQLTGLGVVGEVGGRAVQVGRVTSGFLRTATAGVRNAVAEAAADGRTVVAVEVEGRPAGVIALRDGLRPGAREAVAALRGLGVREVLMATGDRAEVARRVAGEVGIERVEADLMPEDKLRLVERLCDEGVVGMVGDGVNDAPALARAHVGIAVGAAGADVAMETADVVLMSGDIRRLPGAVALARRARAIVGQNLVLALGVIGVVAPLALFGVTKLGTAVLLHEGSTVLVVLNSLRLLGYRPAGVPRAGAVGVPGPGGISLAVLPGDGAAGGVGGACAVCAREACVEVPRAAG